MDMVEAAGGALQIEQVGQVLVVGLNRPEKRNALTRPMIEGMAAAAMKVEEDPNLRAGVFISTTPDMFCAGADLNAVRAGELSGIDGAPPPSFTRTRRTKPWIAAVSGAALGGGFELALACEMIVADEGATFGLPEVRRGLVAAGGGVFRLPRRLPRAPAMEILLTGRPISAGRAYELGLINILTSASNLRKAALGLAGEVAECAPASVRESLLIADQALDLDEDALWPQARAALNRLRLTKDAQEGSAAFLQKRPPVWSGG